MKGRWFDISEEVGQKINATGFQQKWILDPKGYFLVRINQEDQILEVGYCTPDNKLVGVISGKEPEEIMYKAIELEWLSLLDHAAYLGKELQKAHTAMKNNEFKYVQDSPLERSDN